MNGWWVCFALIVGFYGSTAIAILVQLFGRRCPACGACISTVADAVVEGAVNDDPRQTNGGPAVKEE